MIFFQSNIITPLIPLLKGKYKRYALKGSFLFLLFTLLQTSLQAQTKEALRYEIDAKRQGVEYNSKDALPRGREFKRIDSTYYVGWLLEGTYKYEHAADYLGFKAASEQLQKAANLMLKDFKKQLSTRTGNVIEYIPLMKYHKDWDYLCYCLMNCYSNTDDQQKLWALLQNCKKLNLQDELYLETYNYLAWTVHRNRFYKSDKFSFLKNSIKENEAYANKLLDSSIAKIKRDAQLNKSIFSIDFESTKMPGVWHYKSILFSYQLNIESGAYYYEKLRNTVVFPSNNFATFCVIQAKFKEADEYYQIAKLEETGDKRMKESYYYSSIINAYKGMPKNGINELKEVIKANGSTPGFGWYNIALTRDLLYDGQIEFAKRYALKAAQFKEIHIGTTLGQSHYDFSVALMNLMIKIKEIERLKFLDKHWYFSPNTLGLIAQKTIEKYGLQFLIINQFATNPERDNVIYKILSTESTISFDEVWALIDGFSTNYFLDRFRKNIDTEKRVRVKRYYKLFTAKLLMKKGGYKEALSYLESILNDLTIDQEYEKLFLARVYESLIICEKELYDKIDSRIVSLFYKTYPSLIPFSGIAMPMRLHSNEKTENEKIIIKQLKSSNINWIKTSSGTAIDVYIQFLHKGNLNLIEFTVKNKNEILIPPTSYSYDNSTMEWVPKQLCFYIFNVGNADKGINMK